MLHDGSTSIRSAVYLSGAKSISVVPESDDVARVRHRRQRREETGNVLLKQWPIAFWKYCTMHGDSMGTRNIKLIERYAPSPCPPDVSFFIFEHEIVHIARVRHPRSVAYVKS